MAQLVEQRIRNAWVAGSSPASGSKNHFLNKRSDFLYTTQSISIVSVFFCNFSKFERKIITVINRRRKIISKQLIHTNI